MSVPPPPIVRAANSAALPRMRATFPLQVMGEMGLNNGDVWWMDPGELLFWCPELLQVGLDMRGRIDFRNGRTIEVHVRLLQGEVPLRHEKGYLQIASWSASTSDGKFALERLRETCPAVFKSDYRPPRLPAPQEAAAEAAEAAKVREPTEAELLAAKHVRDLAEESANMLGLARRRRGVLGASLLIGAALGVALALLMQAQSSLRWLAFEFQPAQSVANGLLSGANFAGRDLSAAKLAGADLESTRLAGATLRAADLTGAVLVAADLRRADLRNTVLGGTVWTGAQLEGADFSGADLRGADLSGADFGRATASPSGESPADFPTDPTFDGAIFSAETRWPGGKVAPGAVGPGALVAGRSFSGLIASGMDLSRADFSSGTLPGALMVEATLVSVNFSGATLHSSDFSRATLTGATLDAIACKACTFAGASLDQISSNQGQFEGADFTSSRATAPKLQGANLARAKFSRSIWGEADLKGANLQGADLSAVEWSRCVLSGADLSGAILSGAKLTGCVSDGNTRWPPGAAARNYGVLEIVANGEAHGAVLPEGSDWSGRDLHGLRGARMTAGKANWTGANLEGADLSNASLGGGNFEGSRLVSANFAGANLGSSRFAAADLAGADLAQADVCGADFATANLANTNFDRATACSNTQWPKNKPPKGITIR